MKDIILAIGLFIGLSGSAFAYTNINASHEVAFTSSVSVSTTPVLFVSNSTLLNLEELHIWQYAADVVYINFTLPTSSTTAAASGIRIFQSDKNDGYIRMLINKAVTMYLTLAADSGTASVRVAEFGRTP